MSAFPVRFLLVGQIGAAILGLANRVLAAEYYVAPSGSDSNAGTQAQPFASLQKAANTAVAGDTVWIRGGTYNIVTPATSGAGINITKSGTSDTNRIKFWAYPGEVPAFDFAKMVISTTGYTVGIAVSGSWLHFKGLEVRNVPMNTRSNTGFAVNDPAHHNIFEQLNLHHNNGSGFFISHGGGGHLILNSDSHDNYDPTSSQGDGQNADGFGVHYQEGGAVTTFQGCRAWWNSDDGWDFISQEHPVLVENSWAFSNGYINAGAGRPADGSGNGYKAGSSKTGIRHILRNNLAWKNRAAGFYANHSSGGNDWFNNTAYSNGTQYNLLASTWDAAGNRTDGVTLTGARAHKMRNNIGFPNKNSYVDGYGVDTAFNTWDLKITPANGDFASVAETDLMGPRQADGSLPNLDFLKLRAGSQMIDKGTNVGLPHAGAAPDLGAYEFGLTSSGGAGNGGANSGGASASGGNAAKGGATSASGGAVTASGGVSSNSGGRTSAAGGVAGAGTAGLGSGGVVTMGGSSSTSGGSGGTMSTEGGGPSTGVGGSVASGGSAGSGINPAGGSSTGGSPSSGGSTTQGGSSAGSGTTAGQDAEGCGCRLPGSNPGNRGGAAGFALLAVAALAFRRRKISFRQSL